jgi:hypothetical protein
MVCARREYDTLFQYGEIFFEQKSTQQARDMDGKVPFYLPMVA